MKLRYVLFCLSLFFSFLSLLEARASSAYQYGEIVLYERSSWQGMSMASGRTFQVAEVIRSDGKTVTVREIDHPSRFGIKCFSESGVETFGIEVLPVGSVFRSVESFRVPKTENSDSCRFYRYDYQTVAFHSRNNASTNRIRFIYLFENGYGAFLRDPLNEANLLFKDPRFTSEGSGAKMLVRKMECENRG